MAQARAVVHCDSAPTLATGAQCFQPFEVRLYNHCASLGPQAEAPPSTGCRARRGVNQPGARRRNGVTELRDPPDDLAQSSATARQARHTVGPGFLTKRARGQAVGSPAARVLHRILKPSSSLCPSGLGTRPYQQIGSQFSVHHLDAGGHATTTAFLDLSGHNPCRAFARGSGCGLRNPRPRVCVQRRV